MAHSLDEQLTKYLADAHSIETEALAQLRTAPEIAGSPELSAAFRAHLAETERHERLMRERLDAHGGAPSKLKEAVMAAGGKGFVLFARSQADTAGKLATHAFSYEALELASYELLMRVAERAGDTQTVEAARSIRAEEAAMRTRLARMWDEAVEASLRQAKGDDLEKHLVHYLADAHAIEGQAIQMLEKAPKMAGEGALARLYEEHLEETRAHHDRIRERLEAHGEGP